MRFFVVLLIIFAMSFSSCAQERTSGVNQLNATAFRSQIQNRDVVLLDVRTPREFQNGHIENSGQLNFYDRDFAEKLLLLPRNKPVYLYCNTGYRSNLAAGFLIRNGYTQVYNLQRGIMEWEQARLPVKVDPAAVADVEDKFEPADFSRLVNNEPLVFIDFYAPWCAPCRKMMPMIDSLKTEYHGRIAVIKINADASKQLVREIRLPSVPYFVLFQNGQPAFQQAGEMTRKEIEAVLYNALKK
jgi:thioredoxin 1